MRNLLVGVAILLVSVCIATAQDSTASDGRKNDPKSTTVQGCLTGAAGSFKLTSNSGKTYFLVGNNDELAKLAGKEVSVTGSEGSASAASTGMSGGRTGEATSNPTAGTAPTIQVKTITKVSANCSAKGNSQ